MFALTKQEKTVLSLLALIVLSGSMLRYAFKKYPALKDMVNLVDGDTMYSKVDINTASLEELVDIPYIGEYTAASIIRYRQAHGPFKAVEEIKNVKGIREKNYAKFCQYLRLSNKK